MEWMGSKLGEQKHQLHSVNITLYTVVSLNKSIISLVRTPGDRRNLFALTGIRILNRCIKYRKGFEGAQKSARINRVRTNERDLS